jgi:hypothetical protein
MPENTADTPYHQLPDHAFWTATEEPSLPEPPSTYRGRFVKGQDPRRHVFTRDECSRGFWAAIESITIRYPHAIMPDGRHIAVNFLRSREQAF